MQKLSSEIKVLEIENEGLADLIYEFIQGNGLKEKFRGFLELKQKEERYYCDIDFLLLDYK